MLNHMDMNKASSLVNVYWQLAFLPDHQTKDKEFINAAIKLRRAEIDAFKERRIQEQIKEQEELMKEEEYG